MNKKFLKVLALVGCALLLVTASIVGTYAVLTAQTTTITNTFTAGNVVISLSETSAEATYKLIPGKTYANDPSVHVATGSEECWLFVKVENGISAIESGTTIANQLAANGWTLLEGYTNVYWHAKVDASTTAQNIHVFENFTIATDANVAAFEGAKIAVTAYAVQAEGYGTAKAAWDASGFGTVVNS